MAVVTYYFNASDAGPTDNNSVWTNDANAFDGSTTTEATVDGRSTVLGTNDLQATGTDSPTSGGTITQVRARAYIKSNNAPTTGTAVIYTSAYAELLGTVAVVGSDIDVYTAYVTLSAPSGGWSWTQVNNLALSLRKGTLVAGVMGFARIEAEVTYTDQGSANTAWLTV